MTATTLPNASAAIIDERKLTEYLLNLAHRKGGPKAKFFLGRGFRPERLEELADALSRDHAVGRRSSGVKWRAHFGADRAKEYSESISSEGPTERCRQIAAMRPSQLHDPG